MTANKSDQSRPRLSNHFLIVFLFFITLGAASCSNTHNTNLLASLEKQVTVELIYTPSATPTITPTSTATQTPTPTPTITPIPTLIPTATPIYPPRNLFLGTWRNIDPNTKSYPRIEITILQGNILFAHFTGICSYYINVYGALVPFVYCGNGYSSGAIYEGNPVILFSGSILILDGDVLQVTTFIYNDSGRIDHINKDIYRK